MKKLVILIVALLITNIAYAISLNEEKSTTARIVGDSPIDMQKKLESTSLQLYYSHIELGSVKPGQGAIKEFLPGNFFDKRYQYLYYFDDKVMIKPDNIEYFPLRFSQFKDHEEGLFIATKDYSGFYSPKASNAIISKHSSIVPLHKGSDILPDMMLCEILRSRTLGEAYLAARNDYYRNVMDNNEIYGISLQSYELFANPNQKLMLPTEISID